MNRYIALVCVLLLTAIGITTGCSGVTSKAQEATFEQLFANPAQYNGKKITVEGFCFSGFEVIVLSENLEYSGYAPRQLVPKGRTVWIEVGIPQEVFDKLYQQQIIGPSERYGKVRLTGKFEYGTKYGHLGAYITGSIK